MKNLFYILFIGVFLLSCGTENEPTYKLTTTVSPTEGGTISPSTGVFSKDEVVELIGTPSNGWRFVRWEGDWEGEINPVNLGMTRDLNVIGVFTENPVYLSENGVTIMCPNGNVGDIGIVNGVEYEIVDRNLLITRRNGGKDLKFVCVSNVTDMRFMFRGRTVNGDITNWDVSSVTDMREIFGSSPFNQPIGDWDVSSVTDMRWMFFGNPFNQPIGNWDVSNVTDMSEMFSFSQFNQPINRWCVTKITSEPYGFSQNSPLTPQNKPIWGTCPTP